MALALAGLLQIANLGWNGNPLLHHKAVAAHMHLSPRYIDAHAKTGVIAGILLGFADGGECQTAGDRFRANSAGNGVALVRFGHCRIGKHRIFVPCCL